MDKNEAIKILKDFHDESAIFSVRTALETLHPEFAKSEDERIRKALVDALNKNLGNGIEKYGTTLSAALDWLEKQDPKKHEEELDAAYKTADKVQYHRGYEAAWKEMEEQPPMQNGITINGVEYELIEDNEADECERCALREKCHYSNEVICTQIFENLYAHHRFEKR